MAGRRPEAAPPRAGSAGLRGAAVRGLALALGLAAAACARGPEPVHVVALRVADGGVTGPLREAGIDERTLDDAARAGLRGAGFASGEGGRPYRAEVSVASVRLAPPNASGGAPRVELTVELSLMPASPGSGGAARETGTAAAPLTGGDPSSAWRSALVQASRRAADALALAFAEEAKPLEKVLADLGSSDPRLREHAVRVLAERRSADAVPALIGRLKDEDPRVVHRAVGALAQIGDPRAVAPLIDLSRSGDASLAARVARLVGDIGGPEAEGYLLTVEAGHPDPRVRTAARDALAEMHARGAQGGALSARK